MFRTRRELETLALAISARAFFACSGSGTEGATPTQHPASLDASAHDAGESACPAASTPCPNPVPPYADVAPILASACVPCHDGTSPQWPLNSYDDVVSWGPLIVPDLAECTMPPADGGVLMSPDQRVTLLAWLRCGSPQ